MHLSCWLLLIPYLRYSFLNFICSTPSHCTPLFPSSTFYFISLFHSTAKWMMSQGIYRRTSTMSGSPTAPKTFLGAQKQGYGNVPNIRTFFHFPFVKYFHSPPPLVGITSFSSSSVQLCFVLFYELYSTLLYSTLRHSFPLIKLFFSLTLSSSSDWLPLYSPAHLLTCQRGLLFRFLLRLPFLFIRTLSTLHAAHPCSLSKYSPSCVFVILPLPLISPRLFSFTLFSKNLSHSDFFPFFYSFFSLAYLHYIELD